MIDILIEMPGKHTHDEPTFAYGTALMLALSPPLAVLLAFGGRPTIVALCFGSIVAYIFDILGTMEVNQFFGAYVMHTSSLSLTHTPSRTLTHTHFNSFC